LEKLSEQQCLDCADKDGCHGDSTTICFEYAKQTAIVSEAVYPYNGFDNYCTTEKGGDAKVVTYAMVPKNNSQQLMAAIVNAPVAVGVDGFSYPFMHYMSGIITDPACGTTTSMYVTAVGYGVENNQKYYILKNSWGADWGDHGYLRVGYSGDGPGICGV